MDILIETVINLVAIVGIVAIIGSFFDIFSMSYLNYFKRVSNKIFDFRKNEINSDKTVTIDIYLNNMSDTESDKMTKEIKNSKCLNDIADYINIYKTFDKK
ncbi:MAG: hypothetical protein PHD15_00345 [Clostridia bacterium]|nr:hypothetical protein [Clostridia bacterium]MDD4386201.1 hypothetical protein [Clostridia bacterium]